MPSIRKLLGTTALVALLASPLPTSAATVTMTLVDTFVTTFNPFGLAFDGTNLWVNNFSSTDFEMTTSGVFTGVSTPNTQGASALAWSGTQLASSSGNVVRFFDRITGGNATDLTLNGPGGFIDGLDIGGGLIYHSRDVSDVRVFDLVTGQPVGPQPFITAPGGYSGVERIDIGATTFFVVVNDGSSPRTLCVHDAAGVEQGCTTFGNSRYEDLAFDGRYLYAADVFGFKIDKIDLSVDGVSIFVPPSEQVPEPGSLALLGAALGGVAFLRRRKVKTA